MEKTAEQILRQRMHGLYLSRPCESIVQLSHELLGLHGWFHRNVTFSALIRGASLTGWKTSLTKTWLYRGTLHGVVHEDLPLLLALHKDEYHLDKMYQEIADRAIALMEDGVYSRSEMRLIFAEEYDKPIIDRAFSPWGGIFCELARIGKVSFRNMTSRDFDLIDAEPVQTFDDVLPGLFKKFITAYGPATLADAAWFFGLTKEKKDALLSLNLEEYAQLTYQNETYYYIKNDVAMGDIPKLTLLSGFDPLVVSYTNRDIVLPQEYKKAVILKSGICLPTIAINGQIAGTWNIKKGKPVVDFFATQPKRIQDASLDLVADIQYRTSGIL